MNLLDENGKLTESKPESSTHGLVVREDFDISQMLAEDIASWDNDKVLAVWKGVWTKEKVHDLDLTWIDILTHEMCFRTSEEKIETLQASPLQ